MGKTSIEWTDHSVNPIRATLNGRTGHYCEKVSPGCKNCYSSRMQRRFGMPVFQEQRGKAQSFLDVSKLEQVFRRRKPTKWFWCDMSDMFGAWVPDEWIAACFGVMAATPQHVHQVLTKRPERAAKWFEWVDSASAKLNRNQDYVVQDAACVELGEGFPTELDCYRCYRWPLPNVWIGTSCENQETADERIPWLFKCPAAVRFVSAEPLLGPIDLHHGELGRKGHLAETFGNPLINWVIIGSESGPGARPMQLEWAESLRDQCADAGVAFFTKQIANARDRKGGNPEFWPAGPWPREFPVAK